MTKSFVLKFSQKFIPKKIGYYFLQSSWEIAPCDLELVYISRDKSGLWLHGAKASIPQEQWSRYWKWSKKILFK